MLTVQPIQLGIVLPTDSIGFVFMHPFLNISSSEPYKWEGPQKTLQIARIERCLGIAISSRSSSEKTHFTIFPEYSIPGLEGIDKINAFILDKNWRIGTIVIGGVDGLTKQEYSKLCQMPQTLVDQSNKPEIVKDGEWINCMVTWEVTEDEEGKRIINRWVQPKLCPSGLEEGSRAQNMFEGKCVNIYESRLEDNRTFRFFCLLCYDWVAPLNSGIAQILSELNKSWSKSTDPKAIQLVFVLQNNSKPNDASFLNAVVTYFNEQTNSFVGRTESIIAFVNTAGKHSPGYVDSYGFSSLIYSPNLCSTMKGCPPSYAINTEQLRQSNALATCRDSLFRENGACIHSFQAFQPRFMIPLPASTRRFQLNQVSVYGIDIDSEDPRTPGGPVAAIVKWVNDRLDLARCLDSPSHPIQDIIQQKHEAVARELRLCDHKRLEMIIRYADNHKRSPGAKDDRSWLQTIDQWAVNEYSSLLTLLDAFSLIGCISDVKIDSVGQAYVRNGNDIIDVIVVSGPSHISNMERVDKLYPGYQIYQERGTLIISRDYNDGPLTDLEKRIDDMSDIKRCDFHTLKACLGASDLQDFMGKLHETIGI